MGQEEFFRRTILAWEGGLSLDPDDRGNWFASPGCAAALVGSKYGVTAAALAAERGCAVVTAADMAALSLDEAVRIGLQFYYRAPGFDALPWDPVIASVVDFGWGAGPGQAIRLLQRLIGVTEDGAIGRVTRAAYARFVATHGLTGAATRWQAARDAYYRGIVRQRPTNAKYLNGWLRRSASFAPGTRWWRAFEEPAAPRAERA